MSYHNQMLFSFVASDTRTVVYLKQSEETKEYAVKVMHKGGTKYVVLQTYSLSSAMREFAETIATFTNGFTFWSKLE